MAVNFPSTKPDDDADAGAWLDWANTAMKRTRNPLVAVAKFGNVDALFVLTFENGDKLRLPSKAAGGRALRNTIIDYDGHVMPAYSAGQGDEIRAALVRAAGYVTPETGAAPFVEHLDTFLTRSLLTDRPDTLHRPDEVDLDNPRGAEYRAVCDFRDANRGRSGHPAELPPVLLFWTRDGGARELWVPRGGLQTFLEARRVRLAAALRAELESVGWQHRDVHKRSAAGGDWHDRAKAKVWVVPVPWEPGDVDLEALCAAPAERPPSPAVPSMSTRARQRPSRVGGGDVGGRGDAQDGPKGNR